jgi:GNAT superfamily N-acetyltransferase
VTEGDPVDTRLGAVRDPDPRHTRGVRAIRPLDPSTWDAYAELAANSDGFPSGCWCMGFHPEGVGKDTTAEINRTRKLARVEAGTTHAALVFEGDRCVGWCQFGSPEELPRIKSRAAYDRTLTALPDWRITCFYVRKGHRRAGVSADALRGALDLIATMGGGVVEGYPEPAGSVPAGFLFNGALSTYEQLGFERDRMIGKHRWVMVRSVGGSRAAGGRPDA